MEDELPLALVVEEAKCGPGAEERDEEHDAEGFEEPTRVYKLGRAAKLGCGALLR